MPFKKSYRRKTNRHARHARRRRNIYGTRATFVPRGLAIKRANQIQQRVMYFKAAGTIASFPTPATGLAQFGWRTNDQSGAVPTPLIPDDFTTAAELYQEYKILAIRVRIFAANVGAELITTGPPVTELNRGNTVIYKDNDIKPSEPLPDNIVDVINYGSAKLIPSRVSRWTTNLFRPKGFPKWGCCDPNVPAAERTADAWNGGIFLLTTQCTPGQTLWFHQVTYKVAFRGRNYAP